MSDNSVSTKAVVIERTFDAPIDLVWKLWTEAEHFKNWYGPQGFGIPVAEIDLRSGGKRLICMASPDGSMKMWTTGEFLEVAPTQRIVYTESMADEHGNILSESPMPGHPITTEVTVELENLDGKTRMVMTHAGVPADSPGESGWNQAFDKLTDYVGAIHKNK